MAPFGSQPLGARVDPSALPAQEADQGLVLLEGELDREAGRGRDRGQHGHAQAEGLEDELVAGATREDHRRLAQVAPLG